MGHITGRKVLFFTFLLVFLTASVFTVSADYNETMDSIIAEEKISYGSASFALLLGTDVIDEYFSVQEAAAVMAEKFPETQMEWDSKVNLGQFSDMIMKTYSIKGGLMYRIFPGPRYAVRELRYRKILQGKSYSTMYISGDKALRIIGRVLEKEEAADAE